MPREKSISRHEGKNPSALSTACWKAQCYAHGETSMSDIYGAISDAAANRVIRTLMTWRPSLFNYVAPSQYPHFDANAQLVSIEERWLVCSQVTWPPGVDHNTFPLYTRVKPFKIDGVPGGGIPYCAQVTDAKIDFHPSSQIALPPELDPPLDAQKFAVWLEVAAGIGCPPNEVIDALLNRKFHTHGKFQPYLDLFNSITLDVKALICFSLEVFVTGFLYTQIPPDTTNPPVTEIRVKVDGVEVKDLLPAGLEEAVECYIRMAIRGYVLPELILALEPIVTKELGLTMTINPTLTSGVPVNPAIEHNELRIWLDVDIK